MGKLIPFPRSRFASRAVCTTDVSLAPASNDSERELWPIAALLFAGSLARVVHTVVRHEAFGSEPTLALACVVGLLAVAWSAVRKTRTFAALSRRRGG